MSNRIANTAVIVSSQDELDKVSMWFMGKTYTTTYEEMKKSYPYEEVAKNVASENTWSRASYFREQGYTILSFSEFEKKYVKPKNIWDEHLYVHELTVGNLEYICKVEELGSIYTPHFINVSRSTYYSGSGYQFTGYNKYRPATSEEIAWLDACIAAGKYVENPNIKPTKSAKEDDLLVEAKRRFPKGTKFTHPNGGSNVHTVEGEHRFSDRDIVVRGDEGGLWTIYRAMDKVWATIKKEAESEPAVTYKPGDWVILRITAHKYVGKYVEKRGSYYIANPYKLLTEPTVYKMEGGFKYLDRLAQDHEIPEEYRAGSKSPEKAKEEDLMAKAQKDYPIGTKFKSALSNVTSTVVRGNYSWNNNKKSIGADCGAEGVMYVYHEGKWAEIVKDEPKYRFRKGDWLYVTKDLNGGHKNKGDVFQVWKDCDERESNVYFQLGKSIHVERVRLATSSEIYAVILQKSPEEAKPTIKVGDWIYALPGSGGWGLSPQDEGKAFKVLRVSNDKNAYLTLSTTDTVTYCNYYGANAGVYSDKVRIATKEEVHKAQKGKAVSSKEPSVKDWVNLITKEYAVETPTVKHQKPMVVSKKPKARLITV